MKKLLIFTICFLNILGQVKPHISACGYSGDYEIYSMFAPQVIGERDADYFRTLYSGIKVGDPDPIYHFKINNTDYWFNFFNKAIPKADIDSILYAYTIGQIDDLIFDLKDQKKTTIKNQILQSNNVTQAKSFLYYIGFAKRCEGVNRPLYFWGEKPDGVLSSSDVEQLISAGLVNFKSNPFKQIKERYLMQLTRLHFALGLDQKKTSETTGLNAYSFYLKHKSILEQNSTTDLRARAYAAGHLKRIGQVHQANLLYAQLHRNSWMKNIGQMGFKVQEPNEFQATLRLAKNQQDKITLWKLQGLELDGLSAMKAIYKLDPSAPELNLLLVRAVNMQEEDFDYHLKYTNKLLYKGERDEYHYPYPNFDTTQHNQIFNFIKQVANRGNTHLTYAWDLASGYLSAIHGNKEEAAIFLANAKRKAPQKTLIQEQIRLLGLINHLENYKQLNANLINTTLPDLKWLFKSKHHVDLRTNNAKLYTRKKLSYIHYNARRPLLAHCTSPFYEKGFYTKVNNLNQMIGLMKKENKTAWEQFMVDIYTDKKEYTRVGGHYSNYWNSADVNHLSYMRGLIYTYQGNFDEAIAAFEQTKHFSTPFKVNVFNSKIHDCMDCDHINYKGKRFSSLQFVKSQKSIMEQINMGKDLAKNYFELANSYYNISYFGNNRAFYFQTMLMNSNPAYYNYNSSDNYNTSPLYFLYDNQLSVKYYMLASQNSSDPEFKAKCHYMAAKCERNAWYSAHQEKRADEFPGGVYFGLLKKNFNQTSYYQEIIKECGYFESYLSKQK